MTEDSFGVRLKKALRLLVRGGQGAAVRGPIPDITQEEVEEARRFFPRPKFFIFGHARSGTTLLARLVRQHREIHCNWQGHFFTRPPLVTALVENPAVAEWLARPDNRWNRRRDLSPVVLRAVVDFILERDAVREGKSIVGDKSPSSLLHGEAVERLAAVYPDARLIYIVRDGRDALISQRLQSFVDAVHTLTREDVQLRQEFLAGPEDFLGGARSIFFEGDLRRRAGAWARDVAETTAAGMELFGDRFHSLRFEDLLGDPQGAVKKIWDFLGAALPAEAEEEGLRVQMGRNLDAEWQREQLGEVASRIPKGGTASWRSMMTTRDLKIVEDAAGPTLRALGYASGVG